MGLERGLGSGAEVSGRLGLRYAALDLDGLHQSLLDIAGTVAVGGADGACTPRPVAAVEPPLNGSDLVVAAGQNGVGVHGENRLEDLGLDHPAIADEAPVLLHQVDRRGGGVEGHHPGVPAPVALAEEPVTDDFDDVRFRLPAESDVSQGGHR